MTDRVIRFEQPVTEGMLRNRSIHRLFGEPEVGQTEFKAYAGGVYRLAHAPARGTAYTTDRKPVSAGQVVCDDADLWSVEMPPNTLAALFDAPRGASADSKEQGPTLEHALDLWLRASGGDAASIDARFELILLSDAGMPASDRSRATAPVDLPSEGLLTEASNWDRLHELIDLKMTRPLTSAEEREYLELEQAAEAEDQKGAGLADAAVERLLERHRIVLKSMDRIIQALRSGGGDTPGTQ